MTVPAMIAAHVLVMAKAPRPGRVKTRLCPPLTPDQAAAVATSALADTLTAVAACGAQRRIVALDGAPGPWLPPGFEVIVQRGDGFEERLANAWSDAGGPGVQIGMDTPQVTAAELDELLALLTAGRGRRRAVLAPAQDGGWWAIGLPGDDPRAVFGGVPMSTPWTGAAQERRLRELGYDVVAGPVRRDIDTAADLAAVAAAAPSTRTGRLAAALLLALDVAS
ncbi:MAG: DUF2064 domain-containing protein [Actinomycetota bacterium]|jgi:uncharacterized protein